MQETNIKLKELMTSVNSSLSSIFSKDDVMKILDSLYVIEKPQSSVCPISENDAINSFIIDEMDKIMDQLDDNMTELVSDFKFELQEYELEIDMNKMIDISSFEIKLPPLRDAIAHEILYIRQRISSQLATLLNIES